MTLEIPVNVNNTLNQKRLPVIPGFTSLYAYKKRSAFQPFQKITSKFKCINSKQMLNLYSVILDVHFKRVQSP